MKFSEQLRALGFDSYGAYLASPGWKQFRLKYRAAGGRVTAPFQLNAAAEPDRDSSRWREFLKRRPGAQGEGATVPV